jgi:MFS family permease
LALVANIYLILQELHMLYQLLPLVVAPLFGLFIASIGNGFISSLTTLRLDAAGVSATVIGLVSASYFIGLTLGAIFNDRLISRIGHIRAYSSFAALTAVTVLLQGIVFNAELWIFLRLINGWATVGIFLVIESWMLLAADPKVRGRVLALYMIAFYGSGMLGQVWLGALNGMGENIPFMVAGILASLSVLPILIIPRVSPLVERAEPLALRGLFNVSPTGVIGSFGSGIAIAGVYTLLPLYLQRIGMNVHEVGHLMAATILGAMCLQYPVGRWSDRHDRQVVLIALSAFCVLISLAILVLPDSKSLLMVLLFLLGGGVFAVYPVAVSHCTDTASADSLVRLIQGLLLINSIGSSLSPLIISPAMESIGASGFFWSFVVLNVALTLFFVWRRKESPASTPVTPFASAAQMSPVGVEMRVTEDMLKNAYDQNVPEEK